MSNSYVLLEKVVVPAAGASSVTFANIPQTGYTDLVVRVSTRDNRSNVYRDLGISFNGSTSNRTGRLLYGDGSTAASYSVTTGFTAFDVGNTATANTFSNIEYYIPNYTSSNNKSYSVDSVTENNATLALANISAGLWSDTAAITSITFTPETGPLLQYSTFYLYGVAKLGTTPTIAPKATGGDVIDTDGTYWYHIFRSSGTFTPAVALTCDYLVVAGGGGGGSLGGGGGAGGLRSTVTATGGGGSLETALSLASATNYTVTIGAGGAGGTAGSNNSTQGGSSVFSTITSTGGGRGGANGDTPSSLNGGSGGGGGNASTGGAGTTNQGYAGGTSSGNSSGNGGGGAGSVGANSAGGTNVVGANGGSGVNVSITGSSVGYAGGGGGSGRNDGGGSTAGGSASSGGGTGGASNTTGTAGTANTGGGGGGGGYNGTFRDGAAGGSGIVVVRYLVA
jgi:hypothetical protein